MINLALALTGFLSYTNLDVDLLPNVDQPLITINTQLDGASPSQIESQITRRVEDAVSLVSGVKQISSDSRMGESQVEVTFEVGNDSETVLSEVRDQVSAITYNFPTDTKTPTYTRHSSSSDPVMTLSVTGDRSGRELTYLVDNVISNSLSSVDGVAQVTATGKSVRQIQILVDNEKMAEQGVTIGSIDKKVSGVGTTVPGGWLSSDYTEYLVQISNDMLNVREFGELVLKDEDLSNGLKEVVYLKEVAEIVDGIEEKRTISRFNGEETLILSLLKNSDANLVDVSTSVREELKTLQDRLPDDVKIEILNDGADYVKRSVGEMTQHLILGGILASLTVLIFLGSFRLMIIAALAIPVSILSTFIMMDVAGYSLNYMTLLALTLAVGLVIDDAVVVLENIWRMVESEGLSPREAALEGMNEISMAVLATTISLVILFLPLSLMPGEVGEYFRSWGTTLAFAILMSMFVSFTLTPTLCALFLKPVEHKEKSQPNLATRLVQRPYQHLLHLTLKFRWLVLLLCGASVLWGGHLLSEIDKEFMAKEDKALYTLNVTLPRGWSIPRISEALQPIENELEKLKGVTGVITTVDSSDITKATFMVTMVPYEQRKPYTQFQSLKEAQAVVSGYPLLTSLSSDPDIDLKLQGDDPEVLNQAATKMVEILSEKPGFASVTSSVQGAQPTVFVRVDRLKAADLGVDPLEAAQAVQILIGGKKATTYTDGDKTYDVYLRLPKAERDVPQKIHEIFVSSTAQSQPLIPLSRVAVITEGGASANIQRFNRRRVVSIQADLDSTLSQDKGLAQAQDVLKSLNLPPDYGVENTGSSKLLKNTALYAFEAFILSVVLMYMVLASQFENLLDPVLILCTLPLAIPFALFSLELAGMSLNLFSVLGLFLLFGIVKKNAILQIDRTNQLLLEEPDMDSAIIRANTERIRPILMTTITLVVAMIPPSVVGPTGATQSPMAVVILGGQSLCLLLTLLLIPAASSYVDQLKNFRQWKIWGRFRR